jgi:hypothetical protein
MSMSRRTEKSYIYYILDYIYFHNKRHPQDMGVEEIRAYLSHLATDKKVAASTQNIALSARCDRVYLSQNAIASILSKVRSLFSPISHLQMDSISLK